MSTCRVVLIEDNPADIFLVRMALKESEVTCDVTTFENGQEALLFLCPPEGADAAKAFVPAAILLDLNTPKSDGFEVLIRIKDTPRLAHVPIAIVTSSQATSDKTRAAGLGVRLIQKPSHLDEFLATVGQAVKEMLGQHSVI